MSSPEPNGKRKNLKSRQVAQVLVASSRLAQGHMLDLCMIQIP